MHLISLLQHNKPQLPKSFSVFGTPTHVIYVIEVSSKTVAFVVHQTKTGEMYSRVMAQAPSYTEQALGQIFNVISPNSQSTKTHGVL
jgi:hypothetical protein